MPGYPVWVRSIQYIRTANLRAAATLARPLPRAILLRKLDGGGQRGILGFRQQEVNVLGHHNVTPDHQSASFARGLQDSKKEAALTRGAEERHPAIAAEGDEMKLAGVWYRFRLRGIVQHYPTLVSSICGSDYD
jgi:hypothetical protein